MGMGDRIKERRLDMKYTQEELAEKLGLQKSAIAKYENGRVENIKRSVISKMADVLECSPCYLLDFCDSPDIEDIKGEDYTTLKYVFDKFGYILQQFSIDGTYTLQHKKQKDFIIIVSTYDLNTMISDISDYISVLISERFEKMINNVRNSKNNSNQKDENAESNLTYFHSNSEVKAAHNDYEEDQEEHEKMEEDIKNLTRPE